MNILFNRRKMLKRDSNSQGVKGSSDFHLPIFIVCSLVIFTIFGCADDMQQLKKDTAMIYNDLNLYKEETNKKLSNLAKEDENIRKQLTSLSNTIDNRQDEMKEIRGKLDELKFQLSNYFNELRSEVNALKKPGITPQATTKQDKTNYETAYKEAFDAYQKGQYGEAIKKFSAFIESYGGTPLVPNAYYWLGDSYMNVKDYENAILYFQEVVDKYPKSDKASRALLLQADAFSNVNDKKSSITILKKVIELFPKTEEAIIAERKLKNLSLQ
jgi:tol-pal system protein YbgF